MLAFPCVSNVIPCNFLSHLSISHPSIAMSIFTVSPSSSLCLIPFYFNVISHCLIILICLSLTLLYQCHPSMSYHPHLPVTHPSISMSPLTVSSSSLLCLSPFYPNVTCHCPIILISLSLILLSQCHLSLSHHPHFSVSDPSIPMSSVTVPLSSSPCHLSFYLNVTSHCPTILISLFFPFDNYIQLLKW